MSFVGKFLGREEMDQKYTLPSPSEVFIVLNAQDKKEAVNAMLKEKSEIVYGNRWKADGS
jgi:hypothetical protein